ncbi:heavy-metal-associated domain-containing protein [Streptomyces sp. NPDC007083]|uniref:heavy-metal-associated domain-containing protein n=1 Tax=Streptomyces sp. NPDC007083 TaxID=3156913 RepID=UPI0033CD0767
MTAPGDRGRSYMVLGMACGHCADAVTAELGRLPGVTEVVVDVERDTVTLLGAALPGLAAVREAVDEAGYELVTGCGE